MIVTLFILAVYFYLISRKVDVSKYGWVPLVSFILYVLGFSVGIGPISWLMMGEILPTRIRSVGASLVVCFNWACVFVVTKTFQDLIGEYNGKPNESGLNPSHATYVQIYLAYPGCSGCSVSCAACASSS